MRLLTVKTCVSCPYTPSDLGHTYDANSSEFCCGRCPSQGLLCMERSPFFRDDRKVLNFKNTNYAKRQASRETALLT